MALFRLIWSFPRFLKSALILSASFSSTELFRDPPLLSTLRLTNLKIYYGAQQNLWEFNTQFYSDSWTHNHQQKEESVGTKPLRNLDFSRLLFQQWRSLGFTSYHNSSHNNEGVKSFGWVKLWKTYSKEWRIYRQNQSPFIWFIECKFLSMKEEARLKKKIWWQLEFMWTELLLNKSVILLHVWSFFRAHANALRSKPTRGLHNK